MPKAVEIQEGAISSQTTWNKLEQEIILCRTRIDKLESKEDREISALNQYIDQLKKDIEDKNQ